MSMVVHVDGMASSAACHWVWLTVLQQRKSPQVEHNAYAEQHSCMLHVLFVC